MIRDAKSPTLVREMLLAYLPEKHRHAEAEDEEPSRRRPDARSASGRRRHGEEKSRRPRRRRSRLVRDLRRPDGPAGRLLRDAGRVLQPRTRRSCRSSPARCATPSACRPRALFRHHRGRRPADAAEAEERRARSSPRTPRRRRRPDEHEPQQQLRRAPRQRPRLRARLGLAAPGAAGHAGDHRTLQAHHDRGDQAGPQHRDRRSGRPLDVSGRRPRSPTSARAGWSSSSPAPLKATAVPHLDHRPHLGDASCRRGPATGRGNSPPTAPTRCARFWRRRACRRRTSSWSPARPTPSRCFPDDPFIAANRRVTITLMREAPPLPANLKP